MLLKQTVRLLEIEDVLKRTLFGDSELHFYNCSWSFQLSQVLSFDGDSRNGVEILVTVWFEVHFDFPVVNPSDPYISMLILHTVLYTFLKVLIRRICLAIKSFFGWRSFPLFSWPECVILGCYCEGKLDADHSKRSKG